MTLRAWSKKQWFIYQQIFTIDELNEFIQINQQKNYFFRGLYDGSFKQYSSIQRFWDEKGLNIPIDDFVIESIKYGTEIYNKYYGTSLNQKHELTVLSFLQHYGYPTPILDFTTSLYNALFFAIDGAKKNTGTRDYEDFISIYAVKPDYEQEDLFNFRTIIEPFLSQPYISPDSLNNYNTATSWKNEIIVLNDYDANGGYELGLLQNQNILAQKGLFILNKDRYMTLEEYFDGVSQYTSVTSRNHLYYGKMMCWDIHKNLLPNIQAYLNKLGISKATMYPDSNYPLIKKELEVLRNELIKRYVR